MPEILSILNEINEADSLSGAHRVAALAECALSITSKTPLSVPLAPPYEGAETYLHAAKKFVRSHHDQLDAESFRMEVAASKYVIEEEKVWKGQNTQDIRELVRAYKTTGIYELKHMFGDVFSDTLYAYSYWPAVVYRRGYHQAWNGVLERIPRDPEMARAQLAERTLTANQLRYAVERTRLLSFELPLPDYHDISRAEKAEIIRRVGEECIKYWETIPRYANNRVQRDLMQPKQEVTILHRPVDQLKVVLDNTTQREGIIDEFLSFEPKFDNRYCNLPKPTPETEKEKTAKEIIQSLQPGDTYELCSGDETMRADELEQAVNEFIKARADLLRETHQYTGVNRRNWEGGATNLTAKLIGTFNGRIQNARLMLLPPDDDFVAQRIKFDDVDPASIQRLALMADFRSAGKQPIPCSADMALFIRTDEDDGKSMLFKSAVGKVSGAAEVKALIDQSVENAYLYKRLTTSAKRVATGDRSTLQNEPSRHVIG